jgi:hypothetical protein
MPQATRPQGTVSTSLTNDAAETVPALLMSKWKIGGPTPLEAMRSARRLQWEGVVADEVLPWVPRPLFSAVKQRRAALAPTEQFRKAAPCDALRDDPRKQLRAGCVCESASCP